MGDEQTVDNREREAARRVVFDATAATVKAAHDRRSARIGEALSQSRRDDGRRER